MPEKAWMQGPGSRVQGWEIRDHSNWQARDRTPRGDERVVRNQTQTVQRLVYAGATLLGRSSPPLERLISDCLTNTEFAYQAIKHFV